MAKRKADSRDATVLKWLRHDRDAIVRAYLNITRVESRKEDHGTPTPV